MKRLESVILPVAFVLISANHHLCLAQGDPDVMTLTDNIPSDKKGKTELSVRHIEENSLYEKIGLKEGDLLKEWNGKKLSKKEDWEFIRQSLKTDKKFRIHLEREGKEMFIHYIVPAKNTPSN